MKADLTTGCLLAAETRCLATSGLKLPGRLLRRGSEAGRTLLQTPCQVLIL